MIIKVLGSSSLGNCYAIMNKSEILIIELGVNFDKLLDRIDFRTGDVVGCLVSHEHLDHAKGIKSALKAELDVYASKGTFEALNISHHRANYIRHGEEFTLGNFTILPFTVQHDVREPLGFLIDHPDTGKILFITDSYYVQWKFPKGLKQIIVEANYCEEILQQRLSSGSLHAVVGKRVLDSHMSIETCIDLLKANDLSEVDQIILIHLSQGNANWQMFVDKVQKATGINTYIATPKKSFNLKIGEF